MVADLVLVPAGYYVWRWYDRSRDVQTTNDAYVRGEITDLGSRVSGYAVEVLSDDGMPVKAIWAFVAALDMAKLVTVHFFDGVK